MVIGIFHWIFQLLLFTSKIFCETFLMFYKVTECSLSVNNKNNNINNNFLWHFKLQWQLDEILDHQQHNWLFASFHLVECIHKIRSHLTFSCWIQHHIETFRFLLAPGDQFVYMRKNNYHLVRFDKRNWPLQHRDQWCCSHKIYRWVLSV